MYSFIESLRSALLSIRSHLFRSFLTTLGIIIGVAAVIAVVSLLNGFANNVTSQFKGLGTNSIIVSAHTPYNQWLLGQHAKLTQADYEAIKKRIRGVNHVTPIIELAGTFQFGNQSTTTRAFGTTDSYAELKQAFPATGRFFNFPDQQNHRRVMVIGKTVQQDLHMPTDPVGQFVRFNGEWFRVIGLLQPQGSFFGRDQDNVAIIPYTTGISISSGARVPNIRVILKADSLNHIDSIKAQISNVLRKRHHLQAGNPDDFRIRTSQQLMGTVTGILSTITLVLGSIVGISLLVGGIGIMNIMLVSVTERTREIGICKSLGARRRDILLQFLIESVVLSLLGGVIGVGLGYGVGMVAAQIFPQFGSATVPWWVVMLAFAFSAGVGIIFGIIPAAKAAKMNPIDALRYE